MPEDPMAGWLAGFTPSFTFSEPPSSGGARCLLEVLKEALAPLLPPGDDAALHVEAAARTGPGTLAFELRGLSPAGRAAVDALAGGGDR